MVPKTQLFDVVLSDGSFFCQLMYIGRPFPKIIRGNVVLCYDTRDLKRFAIEKRPSLTGKNFNVFLTNQRVY